MVLALRIIRVDTVSSGCLCRSGDDEDVRIKRTKGGTKVGVLGSCTKIPVGIKGEERAIVLRILDISNQLVPP